VGNAGKAVSQGVEVEGRWQLTEALSVGGAVAYLDAYYEEFTGATCTVPQAADPLNNPGCLGPDGQNLTTPLSQTNPGGQDLKDEDLVFAPEWAANTYARLTVPLGNNLVLVNGVDINYKDSFYSALDLDPNTKHDSLTTLNARIAIARDDETWSVAVIGKNLTDEKSNIWNNDVPLTNSNSYFGLPSEPRSIALQARYRF
jgi:iron complex outermembrane recepter protein